jgi:hypothetical protein
LRLTGPGPTASGTVSGTVSSTSPCRSPPPAPAHGPIPAPPRCSRKAASGCRCRRIRTGQGAGTGSRSRPCANSGAVRGSGRGLVPAGAYLVCERECVPGEASLSLALPVAPAGTSPRPDPRIASPGTHSRSQTR